LDEQQVKVIYECEKAALERDTTIRVQNWLLTQIEILRRSQSSGTPGEGSWAPPPPTLSIGTTHIESKRKRDKSLSPSGTVAVSTLRTLGRAKS